MDFIALTEVKLGDKTQIEVNINTINSLRVRVASPLVEDLEYVTEITLNGEKLKVVETLMQIKEKINRVTTTVVNEYDEHFFLVDFWFDDTLFIRLLSNYLHENNIVKDAHSIKDLVNLMGALLEKPCLNYTFQDIQDIFNERDQSYYDIMDKFEIADDDDFIQNHVRRVGGGMGHGKFSLIDTDIIIQTTEQKLRDLVEFIWKFIITKSIKTPLPGKETCESHYIWWTPKTDSKMIESVNEFCDSVDSYISKLVDYTMQKNIHILNYDISSELAKEDMSSLKVDVCNSLSKYNTEG